MLKQDMGGGRAASYWRLDRPSIGASLVFMSDTKAAFSILAVILSVIGVIAAIIKAIIWILSLF